jgi:phosphatidyl-myo-inositol dimannoside synthase
MEAKELRILFVSHTLPLPGQPVSNVGGMQRMSAEMRSALAAHPRVALFSRVLESSWRWTGARTGPFLGRLLLEIPRIVARERIDAVLFSSMVTATLAIPLRRRLARTGTILAATPVGRDLTLPGTAYQRLVPRVLAALDLVMPISVATGAECLSRGLPPERMVVVPVGIDLARFPPAADRGATREMLLAGLRVMGQPPLPDDTLLLCSVGRHQERKGFHWFIGEVMPRLPRDVAYLLAGDGPMTPLIREEVRRHGLGERVRLLGRVSEEMLTTLYGGADLFVMPNIPVPGDMEGFGVVMLEAGLAGLPVIAADLEGIRDVVAEGSNGHFVRSGDVAGFVSAIERYRTDRGLLRAASESAAAYTAGKFAWPNVADQYVRAIKDARARVAGVAGVHQGLVR